MYMYVLYLLPLSSSARMLYVIVHRYQALLIRPQSPQSTAEPKCKCCYHPSPLKNAHDPRLPITKEGDIRNSNK